MVSRGLKPTPYQAPKTTIGLPTIVIVPEIKHSSQETKEVGIRLATVSTRRGRPDVQDPAWNSHSKLNCITACIQGQIAGADEALMLDPNGFVATCNSTHFFIVRKGEVWTAPAKYILHGITRQNIIDLCHANGIVVKEIEFSLTKVYSADEAFVTGTMAGQIPVTTIDGRQIGDGHRGPMVKRLQGIYTEFFRAQTAKRADGF
jgi:branched-chain amino acid aminotransferase